MENEKILAEKLEKLKLEEISESQASSFKKSTVKLEKCDQISDLVTEESISSHTVVTRKSERLAQKK